MIHKTISAANELRAPPLARRKRPKLVYHSRLAGIEKNTRTRHHALTVSGGMASGSFLRGHCVRALGRQREMG